MSLIKKGALIALASVIVFLAGYFGGKHSQPALVEDTSKSSHSEKQLQTIVNNTQIDTKELAKQIMQQVVSMMEKRNVSTHKETVTKPDGEVRVIEDTTDKTETNTNTNTRIDTSTELLSSVSTQLKLLQEKLTLDEETKTHIALKDHATNYQLGVQLGYNFAGFLGHHESYNLIPLQGVVAQIQFEKRWIGSLWWVAWVQSTGIGGLGLKAEF